MDVLAKTLLGISTQAEANHEGGGKISGTVNFAGKRERVVEGKSNRASDNTKEVQDEENEGESVQKIVNFQEDDS